MPMVLTELWLERCRRVARLPNVFRGQRGCFGGLFFRDQRGRGEIALLKTYANKEKPSHS